MRTLRVIASVALLALLVRYGPRPMHGQQPAAAVDVKVVKYPELSELIAKQKGKVVLVDFWATTCVPCVKSFFHNVEMDKAYRDKGLVVISVSTFQLDEDNKEETIKPAVLKFLKSQNATFTNVILDELPPVVQKKLHITGLPCIFVFTRDGEWKQFKGDDLAATEDKDHRHPDVEKFVKHFLDRPAAKN